MAWRELKYNNLSFKNEEGKYTGLMPITKLRISYGAGDALEPFYYAVLHAFRHVKAYATVKKVSDWYNITPRTQEFGFAAQNLRQEMSSASALLGQVGQVAKSLVAMKKDLQRINECIDYYKKGDEASEIVLKGIWADFVDSKTGPASLVQAAQKLEFFVARDWFFKLKDAKAVDSLGKDVPNNVKNFLQKKLREYEVWKPHWKERLNDMKKIIEQQYKASKSTIKLYREWVEPLLHNIEALKMKPQTLNPDLLKIGGSVYSQVHLVGWKAYKEPKDAKEAFAKKDRNPLTPIGKSLISWGVKKVEVPFVPVIEVVFTLIGTSPKQYMDTRVDFNANIYTIDAFEKKLYDEWTKDPAEDWIKNLMLKEGLDISTEDESEVDRLRKELEELKKKRQGLLVNSFKKFFNNLFGSKPVAKKTIYREPSDFMIKKYINQEVDKLVDDMNLIYNISKKQFGMAAHMPMPPPP